MQEQRRPSYRNHQSVLSVIFLIHFNWNVLVSHQADQSKGTYIKKTI